MNHKLNEAMDHISDAFIADAAEARAAAAPLPHYTPWLGAVAAVLVIALIGAILFPVFDALDTSGGTTPPVLQSPTSFTDRPTDVPTSTVETTRPTGVPASTAETTTRPTTEPTTVPVIPPTRPSTMPTTRPSTVATTRRPTSTRPTVPSTTDPCANGHHYLNGYCIYCLAADPTYTPPTTSTRPTPGLTTATTNTNFTTKPTTKPTTTRATATTPTASATQPSTYIVRARSGAESIIPIGRTYLQKNYQSGKWWTVGCTPLSFSSYTDDQIPALTLNGSLILEGADGIDINDNLRVYTTKDGAGTSMTLDEVCALDPGTYYIRIYAVLWGEVIQGEQEYTSYFFGFRLIIPNITYITEQITPQGAGYTGKPKPGPYVMKEVDGQFYIDFGEGNQRHYLTDPCLVYPFGLRFDSVEDLYNSLMTGDFTMQELQVIRARFELDENHGFLLPNPRQLWALDTPEGVSIEIEIRAYEYLFYIRSANNIPIEEQFTWQLHVLTKSEYDRYMQNRVERDYAATIPIPEQDAVAYDEEMSSGRICRYVQYTREHDGKQLAVEEIYYVSGQELPSAASAISVLCHDNGIYYRLYHSMATDNIPTTQWLAQFDLLPYTPNA